MFVAGHVGLGLGIWDLARRTIGSRGPVRLGWLAFFALLPDLIDKPVGLIWWELGSHRLFAHSLLFALFTLACCRLLWPRLAPYAWLVPIHLLLDAMWRSRHTLWFPLHGLRFDPDLMPPLSLTSYIQLVLWKLAHQPWEVAGELLGAAVLLAYYLLVIRPESRRPAAEAGRLSRGPL